LGGKLRFCPDFKKGIYITGRGPAQGLRCPIHALKGKKSKIQVGNLRGEKKGENVQKNRQMKRARVNKKKKHQNQKTQKNVKEEQVSEKIQNRS